MISQLNSKPRLLFQTPDTYIQLPTPPPDPCYLVIYNLLMYYIIDLFIMFTIYFLAPTLLLGCKLFEDSFVLLYSKCLK